MWSPRWWPFRLRLCLRAASATQPWTIHVIDSKVTLWQHIRYVIINNGRSASGWVSDTPQRCGLLEEVIQIASSKRPCIALLALGTLRHDAVAAMGQRTQCCPKYRNRNVSGRCRRPVLKLCINVQAPALMPSCGMCTCIEKRWPSNPMASRRSRATATFLEGASTMLSEPGLRRPVSARLCECDGAPVA